MPTCCMVVCSVRAVPEGTHSVRADDSGAGVTASEHRDSTECRRDVTVEASVTGHCAQHTADSGTGAWSTCQLQRQPC